MQEVYDAHGEEFVVLGKYIKAKERVLVKHIPCGTEYDATPSTIIKGFGCKYCASKKTANKRRKTHEQYKEEFFEIYGEEYVLTSEYQTRLDTVEVTHIVCGNKVESLPYGLLDGLHKCLECYGSPKRKTHDEFVKDVFEKVGNEYEVLGKYITSKENVLIKHTVCNHEYMVAPGNFLCGNRCPACAVNSKKSQEKFEQDVYDLVGDEYIVTGKYTGSHDYVLLLHVTCGKEYNVRAGNFLNGSRCFDCYGTKTKTHKEFIQEVWDTTEDEYTVLGEYVNKATKILMKHNTCGYEYMVKPHNFNIGQRCPQCARKERTISHDEFVEKVFHLMGDEYTVLGTYTISKETVRVRHNTCGYEYDIYPGGILRGNGCVKCAGLLKKTTEEFKQLVYDMYGKEYEVLGEYVNSKTNILIKHISCGHEYKTTSNNLLRGHGCRVCNKKASKGEKEISIWLKKSLELSDFSEQATFEECKNINFLPFDFYIKDRLLIEFDGKHHFTSVDFAGKGEEWALKEHFRTVEHDVIKNEYCISKKIPFVRIPYWKINEIKEIVECLLTYFGAIGTYTDRENVDISKIEQLIVDENWNHANYLDSHQYR